MHVLDEKSIHYIKTTIENADEIILGWGSLGHKYFKYLIKEEKVKSDFFKIKWM